MSRDPGESIVPESLAFGNGIAVVLAAKTTPISDRDIAKGSNSKVTNRSHTIRRVNEKKTKSAPQYSDAVQDVLELQLKRLTELKQKAREDVPRPPNALSVILQMPRVQKCFRYITKRKRHYELSRSFSIWYNTQVVQYHERMAKLRTASATLIQKMWLGFRTRLNYWRMRQRQAKKMQSAVSVVNRLVRVYRLRVGLKKKIEDKKRALVFPMARLIQSAVRLFLGRREYLRVLQKELYGELRSWSCGRVDRLLRRPGLQDIETQYLILSAISLATDPLKTVLAKYGLRLRTVLFKYLLVIRQRRLRSESDEEVLKVEDSLQRVERVHMVSEDRLSLLISCFDFQTHERERRKMQEYLDALERHRAETEASSERRAEQLQMSIKKQELKHEQKERELMYFTEYHQRAVEQKNRDIDKHDLATELIKMMVEDRLATSVASEEKAEKERQRILKEETEKVINAKLTGLNLRGGDGSRAGRSISERNRDAREYKGQSAAFALFPGTISAASTCQSEVNMDTFKDIKARIVPLLRLNCSLKDSSPDKPSRRVLLRLSVTTEDRYSDLFGKLKLYRRMRAIRRDDFRFLKEALAHFKRGFDRISFLRHLNRTVKFETKNARQMVLNEAIALEKKLSSLQSSIDKYAMKLVSVFKEELDLFLYLFIRGGDKSFVFAHSPHLFKLKTESAGKDKLEGTWAQQKRNATKPPTRSTKANLKSSETPKHHSKSSINATKNKIVSAESTEDSFFFETEEFLSNPMKIDLVDKEYFEIMSSRPFVSTAAPTPYFLLPSSAKEKDDSRSKIQVPGLSLFLENDIQKYHFYTWSTSVLLWATELISKMDERILHWKGHYRTHLISFYQRMVYVTHTETVLSTTSSAAVLNPNDVSVPKAIDMADPVELYEILCCRVSLKITGLELASNCTLDLKISSQECEQMFGMHPFSMLGRFYYLKALYGEEKSSSAVSLSDISTDTSLILGNSSGRKQDGEISRYHPIDSSRKSLFDKFDMENFIICAAKNEYAGIKALVLELIKNQSIVITSNTLPKSSETIKVPDASTFRRTNKSKDASSLLSRNEMTGGLKLSIMPDVSPNNFLKVVHDNEEFDLHVAPWMCPVHHWGRAAGPEPVWRRMGILDVIRMAKSMPREEDKPVHVLPRSSSLAAPPPRQVYHAFTLRKVRSGPVKVSQKKRKKPRVKLPMPIKTKKKNLYAKRQTRIVDFEEKIKRWSTNVIHFLKERVAEKNALITLTSEIVREKQLRVLELEIMSWEDSLAHLVRVDVNVASGRICMEPPVVPKLGCWSFFYPKRYAKISADYDDYVSCMRGVNKHRDLLKTIPDIESYRRLRYKVFREEELNLYGHLKRVRGRSSTEGSMGSRRGTIKNMHSVRDDKFKDRKIALRKVRRSEQRYLARRKVLVQDKSREHLVREPIPVENVGVYVAEMWLAGGCNSVLAVARVVYDKRRNPRGDLRSLVFSDSSRVAKTGRHSVPLNARIGYVARQLCDDRKDSFACTLTSGRRYLCHRAVVRLRGTQLPVRELPSLMRLCYHFCDIFFCERFSLLTAVARLLQALIGFQLICRAKMVVFRLKANRL